MYRKIRRPPQPRKLTCAEEIVCSSARPDIVCVGEELLVTIRIVDKDTREEKPCGCAGEIWVSSSSVAAGYWGKPELSDETFRARLQTDDGRTYLRTGDEGYLEASEVQDKSARLYVCGRIKDLIILKGKNYYLKDHDQHLGAALLHREGRDAARPHLGACVGDGELHVLGVVVFTSQDDQVL